jgi:hypothetical protein
MWIIRKPPEIPNIGRAHHYLFESYSYVWWKQYWQPVITRAGFFTR